MFNTIWKEIKESWKKLSITWLMIFIAINVIMIFNESIINIAYKIVDENELTGKDFLKWILVINKYIPKASLYYTLIALVLVLIGVFYIRECVDKSSISRKKIKLIAHSTMSKVIFKLEERVEKEYMVEKENLDITEDTQIKNGEYATLISAIRKQDIESEKIKSNMTDNYKYGYMGIAHTPLTMRLGYQIGDEIKLSLFHKYRDKEYFEKLSDETKYEALKIEKRQIIDGSNELIVAISTTHPILDSELNILEPENKSVLKFELQEKGFDVITSQAQVDKYICKVLEEMRKVVKLNKIKKVHIVISSSTTLTFALGQALVYNSDPEVVCYSYEAKSDKLYAWGISIFKEHNDCLVIN